MNGMQRIEAERRRQVEVEGWTAEHDAQHSADELTGAAACYLNAADANAKQPRRWPWDSQWWKPKDRLRNLERAGALYLAAADRTSDDARRDRLIQVLVPHVAKEIDDLLAPSPPKGGETP